MKKTLKFNALCVIMSMAIVLGCVVSASAFEATQTFTGKIVSDDDVDLSGIEVKIYSAVPVNDEEGNLSYYAETYEYSIYTNSNGEFVFNKPTEYCSYTVDISTLPSGYGISKHTRFIVPTKIDETLTIAPVAAANTALEGDSLTVTFADAAGNVLYTDYEIVPSEKLSSTPISASGPISTAPMTEKMSYEALKALDTYTYSGRIVTSGKSFPYSEDLDISDLSAIDKADFLCSVGAISEDEKYEFYLDYLDDDTGEVMECGTSFYYKLQKYRDSLNSTDKEKISLLNSYLVSETRASVIKNHDVTITNSNGTYVFRIFYSENDISLSDVSGTVAGYIRGIYNHFIIQEGFLAPTMITVGSETYFPVYIVSDSTMPNANGTTSYFDITDTTTGAMKIKIKSSVAETSQCKSTFAHEFMHAITNEYVFPNMTIHDIPTWVLEGLAHFTGLAYSGRSTDSLNHYISEYKANCFVSIFSDVDDDEVDDSFRYGTALYFLYIYKELGGWSTIKEILYNYGTSGNVYSAITNASLISSYSNAFAGMAGYNYNTDKYYYEYNINVNWGEVFQHERSLTQSVPNSVAPMASRYEVYNSNNYDGTLTLTIDCNSVSGIVFKKICEANNGDTTISTKTPTTNRFTIVESTFGDSTCEKFILVPVNYVYTGSTVNYTITPNLS